MDRIDDFLKGKIISPYEAAHYIKSNMTLGFSGFTLSGEPKVIPKAIAELGEAKNLTIITGASVGEDLDGALARANMIARRYPYQTNTSIRQAINEGKVQYVDMHLSHLETYISSQTGPTIDYAIIECAKVSRKGIVPTTSMGVTATLVKAAKNIILEVNTSIPVKIEGIHDIFDVSAAPCTPIIPITDPLQHIGLSYIPCEMEKIKGIVITDKEGTYPKFTAPDETSSIIAQHIVNFLKQEIAEGRQPENLLPLQSGVGSVANAVLNGLCNSGIENMTMYTETFQDSAYELLKQGKLKGVSTTAFCLSKENLSELLNDIESYKDRIVLRSQNISNHPEVIRRLGVISMNTPIEFDIYGNVNSSHILGSSIMNGIGGSGDFTRNAGISIFATSSVAKGGLISCVVPMVSHCDHTEHDVQVLVTEQGLADLRWKSPQERAELIIEKCAHPDYRPMLREYYKEALQLSKGKHIPHNLSKAFSWHCKYLSEHSMK